MSLRVWVDPACPFAYVATELADAAAAALDTEVIWEPVLLGALLRAHGRPDVPMDAMPEVKRRHTQADITRRAAWHGLPLRTPVGHPVRSVDALRCLLAVPEALRGDAIHSVFRAAWHDGRSLADRGVLQELMSAFDVDVDATCADPEIRDELRRRTDHAIHAGVFGVPTFQLDDGELEWGVDRLPRFVARHGGTWHPPRPPVGSSAPAAVEVFHDVASPFSYLGVTQLQRLATRSGFRVQLTPILLGGLFHAIGTPIVPVATFSEARRAWTLRDMRRVAEEAGIPFRYPEAFPLRTVTAQRVLVQEPEATPCLYDAAWGRGEDVGQEDVLRAALRGSGFDPSPLLAGAADPAVKATLRQNTERAVALGVCGAPAFRVGAPSADAGPLFWGQDRLDQVEATALGWNPTSGVGP